MSISNYAELQLAVANHTHRSDLTAVIPDFIQFAETRIFNGSEDPQFESSPLRVRAMQNRDAGTVGALGAVAFPTGYIETIRFAITSGSCTRNLEYRSPVDSAKYEVSGSPSRYTVMNNSIYVGPYEGSSYSHDYYKRFDALTTTDTNWLLTNAPNVYLYAALMEAYLYMNNEKRAAPYYRLFAAAINAVQDVDMNAAKGRAGLAVVCG